MDPKLSILRFEQDIQPLKTNPESFRLVGLRVVKTSYPTLIAALNWVSQGKEILLHVEADNYDYIPVRGWWVNENDEPLKQGGRQIPAGGGFQVTNNPYKEDRSWFCFRGWREYHDHESHQDIAWPAIRKQKEYRLPGIILKLLTDLNGVGIGIS